MSHWMPSQGSHGDWKTLKMKFLWNMQNWPKVMEFCYQSWNFTNFAPKLSEISMFLPPPRKSAFSNVFRKMQPMQKSRREMVIENLKLVMEKSWKKYFVKSVGTLLVLIV